MKILLIDNFDSFVYNIYQALGSLGADVVVARNNAITVDGIKKGGYDKIVISPGPGNPGIKRDFGVCSQVIAKLGCRTPILGICLGHQGIVSAFGGRIIRAKTPMHGKMSMIKHDGMRIFAGIGNPTKAMRYHSLVAEEKSLPDCLRITARSEDDGEIMAVQHVALPIFGIQFHPESILTDEGSRILKNFLHVDVSA
ncbi:MAG: aminodeoxychorismate/anthranilate synthase component II [Candidatus Marsarchaeota archaeon]|jgi:anthranilate synthase component 2|nr:aminodeoxychorismate/anthranilate synthase component II [Candidatus Marsarchaeota archaeon]